MKAVAIDDEPIALKVIENYCRETAFITLEKTFEDARDGLKFLNKFPVDLLFLDIDMPGLNGIELYKQMKQDVMVIFITSRAEYAVEGFNLMAVDYLLKPFTFERFQQATRRASELLHLHGNRGEERDDLHIYLRADFSLVKIRVADIVYIEALDDYLKIHIQDQKTLVARMTMKGVLEKLPAGQFVRIHRSFIVARRRITALRTRSVMLDRMELPLGGNYAAQVAEQFKT